MADEIARLRRAAEAVVAIRPSNWDDDEDPEQRAAWLALDAALAGQAQAPLPADAGGCVTKWFVIFTTPGWIPEKKGGWLKDEHLIDFLRDVMLHDGWKPGFRATVLQLTWDNDLWASSASEYMAEHDAAIGPRRARKAWQEAREKHQRIYGREPVMKLGTEIESFRKLTAIPTPPGNAPVPVTIFCPSCSVPHVDEGEWATTRHHKTHQCQSCGHEWRPFPFATVGVAHPTPATPAGEELLEKVARIIDPWAFNQCEWASRDDNDEVLREFIPKRDAALAKADAILAALQPQAGEARSNDQPSLRDKADHLIADAAHRRAAAELAAIRADAACADCLGQGGDAGSRFNPCPTCGKARAHG